MNCACDVGDPAIGVRITRIQTARKAGFRCTICNNFVIPGQRCVDIAGLDIDGDGFFVREHAECNLLQKMFQRKVCGYYYGGPFYVEDAAHHAMAHGHETYWRRWLVIYEQTWKFDEEVVVPPDARAAVIHELTLKIEEYTDELARDLRRQRRYHPGDPTGWQRKAALRLRYLRSVRKDVLDQMLKSLM